MKSPYQVYVFNLNDYSSLCAAIQASVDFAENEAGHYQCYSFPTKDEQLAFIEGVEAVNSLPGIHHYNAVPLEYYLLQVYRGADYDESYTAAREDGAVYDLGVRVSIEELKNTDLLSSYLRIGNRTERCINDGQSNIQMLLVNPFEPSEFYRLEDLL